MGVLILVRHGEPGLKPDDRLAGWVDVPLSRKGIEEALECAEELGRFELDLAFASNLVRTQETLFIILSGQKKTGVVVHEGSGDGDSTGKVDWYSYPEKLGKKLIPIYLTPALNERYYGRLQGRKKQKMEEKYGAEKLASWRWNFEPGPPEGESLKAVYERAVPYFKEKILPAVKAGKKVLVCAHQSSLRALVKYIEGISDEDIRDVRFSTSELAIYIYSDGKLIRENSEISPELKRNI
ncbi:MAG: histidine phosphatase family protein [Methanosarcina thermophila]|jgi:2,3-bisphosphoglycerate-dependent phosphoglycerate mutase|uniref:2,3-bisphosphoglycerate-dependent phosphoglycerate mutase n=3 Tax=Methanosarcina thermophila TaxID=2210 RepID=A0A1I7AJ22_METTE|nr:histidine phosphatase family protein [Methanosarcina thermophila]ALK05998.1 MAG: phosphoglycerate mutase [Methanosarcina sp. 795]AKB12424.1 Phosphoglycerate mutase [Methanosarcina thermophila TM-1]AKB14372.1 Phosphoglycerate mutase [Methanosarcina thermophila CHTI-55]NLU57925.1 phosphoglycerate mutase [Methanosarcina thermophila]SFT74884.1 phosphoglycerate mutase [Methanosarcina thermophila]